MRRNVVAIIGPACEIPRGLDPEDGAALGGVTRTEKKTEECVR